MGIFLVDLNFYINRMQGDVRLEIRLTQLSTCDSNCVLNRITELNGTERQRNKREIDTRTKRERQRETGSEMRPSHSSQS